MRPASVMSVLGTILSGLIVPEVIVLSRMRPWCIFRKLGLRLGHPEMSLAVEISGRLALWHGLGTDIALVFELRLDVGHDGIGSKIMSPLGEYVKVVEDGRTDC